MAKKLILEVEIDFESWMEENVEPKNAEQWAIFFQNHLIEWPKSVLGTEGEMIAVNNLAVNVKSINEV